MGNLIRLPQQWDPFEPLQTLQTEINRLFDRPLAGIRPAEKFFMPDVDVRDANNRWIVRADLPGIKKNEVHVTAEGNQLTLRGERKTAEEKKGKGFYHAERFHGTFSRTIQLPGGVNPAKAKAAYKDGVLEIDVPKGDGAESKKVKVAVR